MLREKSALESEVADFPWQYWKPTSSLPRTHDWCRSFFWRACRTAGQAFTPQPEMSVVGIEKGMVSEPEVSAHWARESGWGEADVLCSTGHRLWQALWKEGEVLD